MVQSRDARKKKHSGMVRQTTVPNEDQVGTNCQKMASFVIFRFKEMY